MSQLSILCLSDYFGGDDAGTAGAGAAALASFEALRRAGADVHLLAGFGLPEAYAGDPHCINLHGDDLRERRSSAAATAGRLIWNSEARRRVVQHLEAFDARHTVVILHQWTRYLSPATLDALSAYPTLVYLHDYFQVCPTGGYYNFQREAPCTLRPGGLTCALTQCDRDGLAHKAVRMARHATKRLADASARAPRAYVHVSDASRAVAQPFLPGDIHYTIYHPLPEQAVAVGGGAPDYDVGYFGRLEPEKGLRLLVSALKLKSWSSIFVGSGSLAGWIREQLPLASIIPWTPHAQALGLMSQCRVIALPSIWRETWGCVTAEALAAGVPVVVSSLAGSSELVAKYGGGQVFSPSEPQGLDKALDQLLGDEAFRKELGAQSRSVPDRAGLSGQEYARRLLSCIATLQEAHEDGAHRTRAGRGLARGV